jgi:hypothetical protein
MGPKGKPKAKPAPRLSTDEHTKAVQIIRQARKQAQQELLKIRTDLRQDTAA